MNLNAAETPQWAVSTNAVTQSAMTVDFMHQQNHWSSVRVGFWASTRNDITIGAYAASNSPFKLRP